MLRQELKEQDGKFFLRVKTRFGFDYYLESGTADVGTPMAESYLYWTRYLRFARSFRTVKAARAMARLLLEKHGANVTVVDQDGKVY